MKLPKIPIYVSSHPHQPHHLLGREDGKSKEDSVGKKKKKRNCVIKGKNLYKTKNEKAF
jgi:hypothetical protein